MTVMQPLARVTTPAPFRLGFTVVGLFGIAVLGMTVHFIFFLRYAFAAVRYPFQLDYGEGIVWQQALLIPGSRMYGDITKYPFIVFHYPPVFHLVSRLVAMFTHDFLIAGRMTSLISVLVTAVVASILTVAAVRRDVGWAATGIGGAVAGLSIFCYPPIIQWAPIMRVDTLAIAFSFLGVLVTMRNPLRADTACLGMTLFVAAVFTKQTSFAAPVATVAILGLIDKRIALRSCGFGFALAVALLLVMMWLTDGRFLLHILRYNVNQFNWRGPYWHVEPQWPQFGLLALAVACIAHYWRLVQGSLKWSLVAFRALVAEHRIVAVFALYLATSSAMLVTLGKAGSASNYLMEWMCVWSVLAGVFAATEVDRALRYAGREICASRPLRAALMLLPPLLLLAEVGITRAPSVAGEMDPQKLEQQAQLVERIRAATKPVLSDDMILLLRGDKPVPWEPAIFAELARMGEWDQNLIINMIRANRFAFVITMPRDLPNYKGRFNPAVDAAIQGAYPDAEQIGGYLVRSSRKADR